MLHFWVYFTPVKAGENELDIGSKTLIFQLSTPQRSTRDFGGNVKNYYNIAQNVYSMPENTSDR
ncbi:hypothetical protein PL10110_230017 [Planktothrix agardhii]|nr:hypothetical protein PL10110_230017 [Planktothrix agardhii]